MANKKISALTALGETPAVGDIIPVTDVSDTTGSAQGTTKKVTVANLMAAAPVQTADIANFSSAFYSTVSETTISRTLSDSDNGKVIVCTNASTITVTIPSTLTAGFSCKLVQGGAGIIRVVAGSGTTLSLIGNKSYTSGQYQVVDLINYASNAYVLDSSDLQTDPTAWSGNTTSISLDGVSDYASFTETTLAASARSFSIWFKMSATTDYYLFLGSDTNEHYIMALPGSRFFYYNTGNGATLARTPQTINTTDWNHLVVADSGSGTVTFYHNGQALTNTATSTIGSFTIKYIGKGIRATSLGDNFPGKLDEMAIFDSALSLGQVANIYKGEDDGGSGGTIRTAGDLSTFSPLHWWRMGDFEGGTGSTVEDQGTASTDLDLTLSGASFDGTDAP